MAQDRSASGSAVRDVTEFDGGHGGRSSSHGGEARASAKRGGGSVRDDAGVETPGVFRDASIDTEDRLGGAPAGAGTAQPLAHASPGPSRIRA